MRTTASGTRSPLSARLVGFGAERALLALGLPVRGIAILLVLVHHFTPAHTTSAISRAVLAVAHRAWMGVDLFFALSGYLIAGIQLDSRETPDALVALARAPRH
jgi:hypothetical protein